MRLKVNSGALCDLREAPVTSCIKSLTTGRDKVFPSLEPPSVICQAPSADFILIFEQTNESENSETAEVDKIFFLHAAVTFSVISSSHSEFRVTWSSTASCDTNRRVNQQPAFCSNWFLIAQPHAVWMHKHSCAVHNDMQLDE